MRLLIHELESACRKLAADRMNGALKDLARVKHIQRQLFEQWAVLETLTPSEYADFRDLLSRASGFQSLQYRLIEFRLGNKAPEMLEVFAHAPDDQQRLREALAAPSLYDETLRLLARRGFAIPPERVERDWSQPLEPDARLVEAFKAIYEARERHWEAVRAVRGARRHRGELPALALSSPEDGGADHRRKAGHRRLVGHRLPARRARPALLPRAVGRAQSDRALKARTRRAHPHRRAATPVSVRATASVSDRLTHSSVACAPSPPGPNITVGMPAAAMNAASAQ